MRASTLGCRFLDRCGCRLGVEISFKDICILAAVLTVDAEVLTEVMLVITPHRTQVFLYRDECKPLRRATVCDMYNYLLLGSVCYGCVFLALPPVDTWFALAPGRVVHRRLFPCL